jgi:hypothetical protein
MVTAMSQTKIEVGRPCYWFKRSRVATRVTVYDVTKDKIVEEHPPYNCLRAYMEEGIEGETITIEFNPSKHSIFYRYRTTSNRGIIIVYYLPPTITVEELAHKIIKAFKYREVEIKKARLAADRYHLLYSPLYYLPL